MSDSSQTQIVAYGRFQAGTLPAGQIDAAYGIASATWTDAAGVDTLTINLIGGFDLASMSIQSTILGPGVLTNTGFSAAGISFSWSSATNPVGGLTFEVRQVSPAAGSLSLTRTP